MLDDFENRRVTVMGLGRFGGGLGAARWLAARGARVLVTDAAPPEALAESAAALRDLVERGAVRLRLGGHEKRDFTASDLVVANPAVPEPWANPFLEAARGAGVPITTEIRLLVERLDRRRTIGVTGTAGKSTTTAMIRHLLAGAGLPAHAGGNIGGSLLDTLDDIEPGDWVVLELSSAMLHWLAPGAGHAGAAGFSPHVGVHTNLTPNHLDWHGTLEHYRDSKENIFRHQAPGDHQVRGPALEPTASSIPLRVPGEHNQRNARAALAAVSFATDVSVDDGAALLADFPGLPHRLELVLERGGRRFYNDSKSTTPAATVRAIRAFEPSSTVHLIVGGYDKKIDLDPITELAPSLGGFYTIGATGPALARGTGAVPCETLETAVRAAAPRMGERDILLLSPGCASWDQWENYEERGHAFRTLVEEVAAAMP